MKHKVFDTFHIDAQHRFMAPIHTQLVLSQIPSVCQHFHKEHGLVRTGTLFHRKDRDHAGSAAVDDEAVDAPLGARDGAAHCWATMCCGSWFVSRYLRGTWPENQR